MRIAARSAPGVALDGAQVKVKNRAGKGGEHLARETDPAVFPDVFLVLVEELLQVADEPARGLPGGRPFQHVGKIV